MRFLKSILPVTLAFVMGVLGVAVCFSPHPWVAGVTNELAVWSKIIGGV